MSNADIATADTLPLPPGPVRGLATRSGQRLHIVAAESASEIRTELDHTRQVFLTVQIVQCILAVLLFLALALWG